MKCRIQKKTAEGACTWCDRTEDRRKPQRGPICKAEWALRKGEVDFVKAVLKFEEKKWRQLVTGWFTCDLE